MTLKRTSGQYSLEPLTALHSTQSTEKPASVPNDEPHLKGFAALSCARTRLSCGRGVVALIRIIKGEEKKRLRFIPCVQPGRTKSRLIRTKCARRLFFSGGDHFLTVRSFIHIVENQNMGPMAWLYFETSRRYVTKNLAENLLSERQKVDAGNLDSQIEESDLKRNTAN